MTLQEFIKRYSGKGVDFDGSYGYQCMDLYRQYVKDVLQAPQSPPANAKDVWSNYRSDVFERIENTPAGVPEAGDVIIWGNKLGPYGHIAIFIEGDNNTFKSFDQNWPESNGTGTAHIQSHSYFAVLGWLRPKKKETGMDRNYVIERYTNTYAWAYRFIRWCYKQNGRDIPPLDMNSLRNEAIADLDNKYQPESKFGKWLSQAVKDGIIIPKIKWEPMVEEFRADIDLLEAQNDQLDKDIANLKDQVEIIVKNHEAKIDELNKAHDEALALAKIDYQKKIQDVSDQLKKCKAEKPQVMTPWEKIASGIRELLGIKETNNE